MRFPLLLLAPLLISNALAHSRHPAPVPLPDLPLPTETTGPITIQVDADPAHVLNRFRSEKAFGAGVDGVPFHAVPQIYTPSNIRQMLQGGLGPVSYRLYTELSVQDWHWNPAGRFSEPGGQGYWTSDATLGAKTIDTFGYRLPHRGNTHDQGNDDSYSRIDDGDPATYWKSNPYLTLRFTHEPDALHPQWVLADLGQPRMVTAARIAWGAPYATHYAVQFWTGTDPIYNPGQGQWRDFSSGNIANGTGGTALLPLGGAPQAVRYVRVWMTSSSNSCGTASPTDLRNCSGYAIAELGLGQIDDAGTFLDFVQHSPDRKQTVIYASSVDPWHTVADRVRDQEQPGLDVVYDSGVTRGLPMTVPVPMLYSTPENAAAEIAYLKARGDRIARIEMGEEPDGEYVLPEDDAALYIQFAQAIHAVDPGIVLGGPVFQSNLSDVQTWPDANGETSWTKRFLAYLDAHGRLKDFGFFSFEHYPFAACGSDKTQQNLLREPNLVKHIMDAWRDDGLPASLPIFVTELSYSQNETDASQEPAGAIWLADFYGSLLSAGGAGAFFYEYEPIPLSPSSPCPGFGSYGLLLGNANYRAEAKLSQFFAARLLTDDWAERNVSSTLFQGSASNAWVTAYPLQRPDKSWSVLVVNRDLSAAHKIVLSFVPPRDGVPHHLSGPVTETTFGADQYGWVEKGLRSHPQPDGPSLSFSVIGDENTVYNLPKGSITVFRGSVQ